LQDIFRGSIGSQTQSFFISLVLIVCLTLHMNSWPLLNRNNRSLLALKSSGILLAACHLAGTCMDL
jgi:hypothetical protein